MKKAKQAPICSEFIIAAVRSLRRNPSNLTSNTAAGVSLHRLYDVSIEIYSGKEIKKSLEQLMGVDKILITARVSEHAKVVGEARETHGPTRTLKIDQLPSHELFSIGRWYLDGVNQIDRENAKKYRFLSRIKVYIKADGLPQKVSDCERQKRTYRTLAEKIIASMS